MAISKNFWRNTALDWTMRSPRDLAPVMHQWHGVPVSLTALPSQAPDPAVDAELAMQMEAAERVMREDADVLRGLAEYDKTGVLPPSAGRLTSAMLRSPPDFLPENELTSFPTSAVCTVHDINQVSAMSD